MTIFRKTCKANHGPIDSEFAAISLMVITLMLLTLISCVSTSTRQARSESSLAVSSSAPVSLMITAVMSSNMFGKGWNAPASIRQSREGFVYVIDHGNHRILKLDRDLAPLAERGGLGSFKGMFKDPQGLALTSSGSVYVADAELMTVQRFDRDLNVGAEIIYVDDEDALKYGRPAGLAISVDDDVWIVDRDLKRISVFNRFHEFKEFFADYNSGGVSLELPGAALTLPDMRIAVCDEEAGRIVVYGQFGEERFTFGEGILREPADIAYDLAGRFWVIDRKLEEALCFSSNGKFLFRSGQLTESSHFRLKNPSGICALDDETLLISDTGANRVIKVKVFTL